MFFIPMLASLCTNRRLKPASRIAFPDQQSPATVSSESTLRMQKELNETYLKSCLFDGYYDGERVKSNKYR